MNIDYLDTAQQAEFRRLFPEEFVVEPNTDFIDEVVRNSIRNPAPISSLSNTITLQNDNPNWDEISELIGEPVEQILARNVEDTDYEEMTEPEANDEIVDEIMEEEFPTPLLAPTVNLADVPSQYGRFKGADWFVMAKEQVVILAGLGGIGSYINLFLTRIGPQSLYLFDMDTFEPHNLSGQLVTVNDVGKAKVQVAGKIGSDFSNYMPATFMQPYNADSLIAPVMICGFDNMAARKLFYNKWKGQLGVKGYTIKPENCFFIDGRLLAEEYQILCFTGADKEAMRIYERDYLFSDNEVEEAPCTMKQTSHYAAMVAAHMTGYFTNFCNNIDPNNFPRLIPFYTAYNGVMTTYDFKYI